MNIDHIAQKSIEVRKAATALTDRLVKFEEWICKLPGRIECVVPLDTGDALTLRRAGSSWGLFVIVEANDEKPIRDCGVRLKMAAVRALPDFIPAMQAAQGDLIERLQSSCREFDQFAKLAGMTQTQPERAE
jgi:hypothetical protein